MKLKRITMKRQSGRLVVYLHFTDGFVVGYPFTTQARALQFVFASWGINQ